MEIIELIKLIKSKYKSEKVYKKEYFSKIIYFIEWKYELLYEKPLLKNINYCIGNSGIEFYNENGKIDIYELMLKTTKSYKIDKTIDSTELNKIEKIIDFVLEKLYRLKYNEFVNLYFSTYPFFVNEKYEEINLLENVKEYKIYLKNNKI